MMFELTLGNVIFLIAIVWFGAWLVGMIDGWFFRGHMERDD